ncbi:MAG: mandelate racemase [Anaerolineae bacterium]|nr:mandelate racemase [Anaerolineae bacterium]
MSDSPRIASIERTTFQGTRPRAAGANARLGPHGQRVRVDLARVTLEDGSTGWGWSQIQRDEAESLVGAPLDAAFDPGTGAQAGWRALEYPLWDLAGRRAGRPVYALLGARTDSDGVLRAPCYDTSLYMDDLHLADDAEAADLMAREALEGAGRGHTAFKLKVGRGALHMPLEAGTRRDIAVILAVREAVGPQARILLDANNGYNLNLAKRVLEEAANARVYWLEEAFHEDGELYGHLRAWLAAQGLETLIADGEGAAHPRLLEWAQAGLIDVVQYDILSTGFSRWLELGPQLDGWKALSAPHHYGRFYGNYAACHLAGTIVGFEMVEWDEASVPGVDTSGYIIRGGRVAVPNEPGFGLHLDEAFFERAVAEAGFAVPRGAG